MEMIARGLLVLLPLCAVLQGALEDSTPVTIQAFTGESVILPCHFNVQDDLPTVEWSKEGSPESIAFVYRDGCEIHEMKSRVFEYRTNLFLNEVSKGNISLRISGLQLSDAGRYLCKKIWNKTPVVVKMELFVAAVSEPTLSTVPSADGGVTLQCEVKCWYPEPEVTFLDDRGNTISAEDPKPRRDDVRGCFDVTRRLKVLNDENRVLCRVHQPETNQTRVTEIHIPDCFTTSCVLPTILAITVIIIVTSLALFFRCKYCPNCADGQKCPTTRQSGAEWIFSWRSCTQRNQADSSMAKAITELVEKMDELRMSHHDKEATIRQLTEGLNNRRYKPVECQPVRPPPATGPPKPSADVSNLPVLPSQQSPIDNNPKPVRSTNSHCPKSDILPQSKASPTDIHSQNKSKPALLSDNDAAPPISPSTVVRSMSMSESRPRPSNAGKMQRRYTLSVHSQNRFEVLAHLPEDSEPLLEKRSNQTHIS